MQRTLQTLYTYWNEIRAGRVAPQRLEIEPSRISGILSETFMLERVAAGDYPYRLAGTRLCELYGAELRGRNFLDDWNGDDRRLLEQLLAVVTERGAAVLLRIEGIADARHRVEIDASLLPLLHSGTICRVIGAMSAATSPHWLGHEQLRERIIKQHHLVWPDGRPHALVSGLGPQTPMRQALLGSAVRPGKGEHRRFRVVEGGRGRDDHKRG